jgi:hypothetical protein
MHAIYTVSVVLLLGIFLSGYALGWIMASLRQRSTLGSKLGDASADPLRSLATQLGKTAASKEYRLKCKCGAVWNFRSGEGSGPSDVPTLPDGDSYTCPTCGFAINLRPIREMLQHLKS